MNILLTGGASGLGLEIFNKLSSLGHDVVFTYKNSEKQAELNIKNSPSAKKIKCDFLSALDLEALVREISHLNIDVLINNALPIIQAQQFQKMNVDLLINSFASSVVPCLKITQACIANFRKKRSGRIISILSSYVIGNPPLGYSEYVANKAYLLSMSRSWAVENAKFGISVNSISPSIMRTPLNAEVDERILENLEQLNPFKKLVTIEEVAAIVDFLIRAPMQLNGCNIPINGGQDVI